MQNTPNLPIEIDYQARLENEMRRPSESEPCFICGRPVKSGSGWMIHLSTDGTLFPTRDDLAHWSDPHSQGAFPLGSECAKRVPLAYRFRA